MGCKYVVFTLLLVGCGGGSFSAAQLAPDAAPDSAPDVEGPDAATGGADAAQVDAGGDAELTTDAGTSPEADSPDVAPHVLDGGHVEAGETHEAGADAALEAGAPYLCCTWTSPSCIPLSCAGAGAASCFGASSGATCWGPSGSGCNMGTVATCR